MKDALALALVHFLWQGTLLAVAGAILMRVTKVPTVRYAIGVATMVAMLLAPVMTFLAIQTAADATPRDRAVTNRNAPTANGGQTLTSMSAPPATDAPSTAVIVPTTWILNVWAAGVMVLSLRFIGGWTVARRLATQTLRPVGEELQALAAQMAARLNVRGVVRVCESASVAVPVMIGWLRPVIVLPPAALAALPLAQLEALLAHELAHVRRHDYLVNLLQTGVETLCFYHPAVWWISREVRRHREHCCDDLAVGVCDRLTYVTALSSLASISTPQFALSAAGGSLRDRVRRLIEPATHSASPKGAWIAMLPILLVIAFVAPQAWSAQATTPAIAAPVVSAGAAAVMATTAPEVVPAEQARPSTPAREAERAKAEERELMKLYQAALLEMAGSEQARIRELVEKGLMTREAARAREAEEVRRSVDALLQSSEAARTREVAEVRRAIEANKEAQEATETVARRRIQRAREQNDLALLETKLRLAEAALSRQKELVQKGLATRQSLVVAEEELNLLRIQLEQAKVNSHYEEVTRLRTTTERELLQDLEARRHQRQELVQLGLAAHRNMPALEATATLQPEDRVTITIEGEPDLPKTFTVRADGSIRFPFLGSIRVQGLTTTQVQDAIQKLISSKGLARNPAVTVSAWRMR
jgi:beta-lactamase regulating signal transducer with metallopeptidase domain